MNVATDVARCPACGEVSVLSELLAADIDRSADVSLDRPPSGVRYAPRHGGFELGPFICIWSGGSSGGIYGGPCRRTNQIDFANVTAVREVVTSSTNGGRQLVLEGPRTIKFGSMLRRAAPPLGCALRRCVGRRRG